MRSAERVLLQHSQDLAADRLDSSFTSELLRAFSDPAASSQTQQLRLLLFMMRDLLCRGNTEAVTLLSEHAKRILRCPDQEINERVIFGVDKVVAS
jgi:hypothetical protein